MYFCFQDLRTIIVLCLFLHFSNATRNCSEECVCQLDENGRYMTTCSQGGMREIPVSHIDREMEVLRIYGPKNNLTFGPILRDFKKLQIIRIVESSVPSIGYRSFWGLTKLFIVDLSKNSLTQLDKDNFYGQDNLEFMDLSKNKIQGIPSGSFQYLKVSTYFVLLFLNLLS